MKKIIFICICSITLITSSEASPPFTTLVSGEYVLSESMNTINKKTNKPETLVIIETLKVDVSRTKQITLTPIDDKSKYFAKAKGFITDNGRIQFGFTLVKEKIIFSVNYDGELTNDGYIKGKVIGIYPGAETPVKGEWAMKLIPKSKKTISPRY